MRLFNVKNDAVERQRLINAIERERQAQRAGRRDATLFYGNPSEWKKRSSDAIIERYTARLRELS